MITRKQLMFRRKWIRALRSGKYEQAYHALRRGTGFCCLGVACDVSGLTEWKKRPDGYFFQYFRAWTTLPPKVRTRLGLTLYDVRELASQNDSGFPETHTFLEIANTVELLTEADRRNS